MVRKIKTYNREKIRVKIDGIWHKMYFKSVLKAIKKSYKSYFTEEGHVILESKPYAIAGELEAADTGRATEQEPLSNSDSPAVDQQSVGVFEREPFQVENDK